MGLAMAGHNGTGQQGLQDTFRPPFGCFAGVSSLPFVIKRVVGNVLYEVWTHVPEV